MPSAHSGVNAFFGRRHVSQVMLLDRPQALHARGGLLVLEEIYHDLTCNLDPHSELEVDDKASVLNGLSEHLGMTCWRLVGLIAQPGAVAELQKLAQNLYVSASTIAQHAAPGWAALDQRASPSRLNCACLHPGAE